jgi:hypothetical protein
LISLIKEQALLNDKDNLSIITSETKKVNSDVLCNMPKFKNVMDKCTKLKRKKYGNLNQKIQEIPQCLQYDLTGEEFLRHDEGI